MQGGPRRCRYLDPERRLFSEIATLLTLGAHAQRGLWYLSRMSVCLSVCLSVFCLYAQRENKIATRGGLLLQQLHFKKGDFRKTAAFKSYGLKTKRTS